MRVVSVEKRYQTPFFQKLLAFNSTHFWIIHFQHCDKSWVTPSSHGISNHSTSFLMRETIIGLSDLQYIICCAYYFTECLVARYFESGVVCIFIRYTTIELPNWFQLIDVHSLLIWYSCSFQRGHSSIRLTLFSSYSPYASCLLRQYTDIVQSASCQTLRTLCNILLYAGMHSCYLIIYREPQLKILCLLCLVFIRRTSSTFLCFL